ncbi:MAG: serine/threonine protein kinase [bacterium]|nr:serine/threonine protein kinase [bacterium]
MRPDPAPIDFSLLHAVLDLPEDEREAFVREQPESVRADLRRAVLMHSEIEKREARSDSDRLRSQAKIGPYTLVRRLDTGGFGQVWLATKPGVGKVALKLLRDDLVMDEELLERFKREAQTLSTCNHSGVARVVDFNVEPRPYLAMTLIDGQKINEYVSKRGLDLRARVRLIRDVCRAVEHIHGKQVVHRDLKPENVLIVDEDGGPQVRVIDFGIARPVDPDVTRHTAEGQMLGTMAYMSPEQLGMGQEGTTPAYASDIFQIGRLLFEVLVGEAALDPLGSAGVAKAFRDLENGVEYSPRERLRMRGRDVGLVPRDLDSVTRQASEPRPSRRYSSVTALRLDLEGWLNGTGVQARQPGPLEAAGRYARRHPTRVLAIAGVLVTASSLVFVSERGRRRAEDERARLELALQAQDEHLKGLDIATMRLALREAVEEQVARSFDAPEGHDISDASDVVDRLDFVSLARATLDEPYLSVAEEAYRKHLGDDPMTLARMLMGLGEVRQQLGMFESSLRVAHSVRELRTGELGASDPESLEAGKLIATCLRKLGRHEAALEQYDELRRQWEGIQGPACEGALAARTGRGITELQRQDVAAAEATLRSVIDDATSARAEFPDVLAPTLNNLGTLLQHTGRYEESLSVYDEIRALRERHPDPNELLRSQLDINYGLVLCLMASMGDDSRIEEAEALIRPAATRLLDRFGDDHPSGILALNALGVLSQGKEDLNGILEHVRRAWQASRRLRGEEAIESLLHQANVVMAMVDADELEDAEALAVKTIELSQRMGSPNPILEPLLTGERAEARYKDGRFEEAEPLYLDCHERLAGVLPPEHPQVRQYVQVLEAFYRSWHDAEPDLGKDAQAASWSKRQTPD